MQMRAQMHVNFCTDRPLDFGYNQGFTNYFPTPCSLSVFPPGGGFRAGGFRPELGGVRAAGLRPEGGGGGQQGFGREAPENGAEGAVLENFRDFSENCHLKLQ